MRGQQDKKVIQRLPIFLISGMIDKRKEEKRMGIKRKIDWKERKRIEEKRWKEKNLREREEKEEKEQKKEEGK